MEQYLFGKVATPSDVGKLNRLVIPKAYAEKYFPQLDLDIDIIHSPNTTIKKKLLGTHLNFKDGKGNTWRFRYSYWSSSQSYVITKGWSRFVKENKLHAGDLISFWRSSRYCATSTGLFFYIRIDCRKGHCQNHDISLNNNYKYECNESSSSSSAALISQHQNLLPLIIDSMHEHIEDERLMIVSESGAAPTVPKRLIRLFGVDVETFHSTSPLPDAAHYIHN